MLIDGKKEFVRITIVQSRNFKKVTIKVYFFFAVVTSSEFYSVNAQPTTTSAKDHALGTDYTPSADAFPPETTSTAPTVSYCVPANRTLVVQVLQFFEKHFQDGVRHERSWHREVQEEEEYFC